MQKIDLPYIRFDTGAVVAFEDVYVDGMFRSAEENALAAAGRCTTVGGEIVFTNGHRQRFEPMKKNESSAKP